MTNTTAIGRAAETAAANYLETHGFTILDRNWRNRWCEIDIVARKDNAVHFVEVKYRRTTAYGAGYDFINYEKANRLTRAALAWCQAHYYQGDYQIDALSLSGPSDNLKIVYIPSILC
jgi:putative endonuclease